MSHNAPSHPSHPPLIPAMSPDDARFYTVSDHDDATTLGAWQTVEADIRAQADTPRHLPNVHLDHAASEVIRLAPTFSKLRAPALALLSHAQATLTAQALDSLPRLAFAILYVLRQEALETPDAPTLSDLYAEGLALRERGLSWSATLEHFGHLPAGTTEAIRRGQMSHHEGAADLQDLFNALSPHRALIAQLAAVAGTPLTDADIDRMARLSTLIRAHTASTQSPLSWRVALLRLAARFADRYRTAQVSLRFYLDLHNDPTSIPPFGSLRRGRR